MNKHFNKYISNHSNLINPKILINIFNGFEYYVIPVLKSDKKINKPTLYKSGVILAFLENMINGKSWCSFENISKILNVKKNSLNKILTLLELNGYLKIDRDNYNKQTGFKFNTYRLTKENIIKIGKLSMAPLNDIIILKNILNYKLPNINDIRAFDMIQTVLTDIKSINYDYYMEEVDTPERFNKYKYKNMNSLSKLNDQERHCKFIKAYTDIYEFMAKWEDMTPIQRLLSVKTFRGEKCGRYYDIFVEVPSFCRKYFTVKNIHDINDNKNYSLIGESDVNQSFHQINTQLIMEFKKFKGTNAYIDMVHSGKKVYELFKDDMDPSGKINLMKVTQGKDTIKNFNILKDKFDLDTAIIFRVIKQNKKQYIKYSINGVTINLVQKEGYKLMSEIPMKFESIMMDAIKKELIEANILYKHVHDAIYIFKGNMDVVDAIFKRNLNYYLPDVNAKYETKKY